MLSLPQIDGYGLPGIDGVQQKTPQFVKSRHAAITGEFEFHVRPPMRWVGVSGLFRA